MAGNGRETESPVELLRQLIEESGKWTEELVTLTRQQIGLLLFGIVQTAIVLWFVFRNVHKGSIPIPYLIILGLCAAFMVIQDGNLMIVLWRRYRKRIARRDRWREKFKLLERREEEIEKLLSGEAG